MPDWFLALLSFLAIAGFLYFSFLRKSPAPASGRQDEDNIINYPGTGDGPL